MGYAIAMSPCISCKQVFSYNPMRVPSVRLNGIREPICRACVERANPERRKRGLPEIVPLQGAYEPCEDGELGD